MAKSDSVRAGLGPKTKLILLLLNRTDEPMTHADLADAAGLSASSGATYHLKILRDRGLVSLGAGHRNVRLTQAGRVATAEILEDRP